MKEYFDQVRAKKEEKARRKIEKERAREAERLRVEEEEARLAQEEARREAKKRKKKEKAKQEADLKAALKKDVTMHAAMLMTEIKDDWLQQWKTTVLPTLAGGELDVKGKKQVKHEIEEGSGMECSSQAADRCV
ncbi:hypothetical protein CBR_g52263 [Chara braunii]|uniref:Uncharacterized protein n=1 Tax=Chara braunii TaxID=69332 RepID=A0A388M9Y7_CHABU|nr:hypothetical protein CBR_g52263 [Chara braunii]|eukprot:GBG91376.1 hypothetical protein CBR_g52263 [Chara braunii]